MLVEKENFFKVSYEIFSEFYSHFLQDYHAAAFFNSPFVIEKQIKAQSEVLYNIIKSIQEDRVKDVENELYDLAKRHYQLGINKDTMFDSIDYYVNLLRLRQEELGLEYTTILRLEEELKKTTAYAYIKSIIGYIVQIVERAENIRSHSKYDLFFKERLKKGLKAIEKAFEQVSETHIKPAAPTHAECETGQFLHGLGFDIMSFGNEALRVKTIEIHKDSHTYTNSFVNYYIAKDYRKATVAASDLLVALYELVYNYELISNYWNQNKETLIPKILNNKKYKDKISLFMLSVFGADDKLCTQQCELVLKMLRDIVIKHTKSLSQIFFTRVQNGIFVFINNNLTHDFINFYNSLMEDIELLAENLRLSNISIGNHPVFYLYKFDINKFIDLSSEEIKEMLNIVKEESKIKFKESAAPLMVVNVADRKLELLEKARANLELKEIVLKKVKNKDVDVFVQWIYDANLEKRFFEVLARIKQEDVYIPAYKFINILQRENAMKFLDIAVISKILENIDKIKAITNEFYLNIYPSSLEDKKVVELLKELIKKLSQNNITLNLELTEYAITTSKELFESDVKHDKFHLALDDFGTGYTNYELIGELSESGIIKTIKIDGAIVKKILDSNVYMSMVETITMFCKRNDLRVIYEFVDSNQILEALTNIASSINFPKELIFFQGFHLHKPSPLEGE